MITFILKNCDPVNTLLHTFVLSIYVLQFCPPLFLTYFCKFVPYHLFPIDKLSDLAKTGFG